MTAPTNSGRLYSPHAINGGSTPNRKVEPSGAGAYRARKKFEPSSPGQSMRRKNRTLRCFPPSIKGAPDRSPLWMEQPSRDTHQRPIFALHRIIEVFLRRRAMVRFRVLVVAMSIIPEKIDFQKRPPESRTLQDKEDLEVTTRTRHTTV